MKINRNMSAVIANNQLLRTENKLKSTMLRLSSGYKINSAEDNPAGMAISNKMKAQIDALDKAQSNAADAKNTIEIADGALNEVSSILQRIRELSVQADNGNYTLKDGTTLMQKVHGYVLALHDANVGNSCQWGSYGTEVGCDRNNNSGFNGYSSTQTIVAFNKDKNWNLSDAFPAVYHAVNYETVCPAPSQTSGWFLPSGGQ